MVLAMRARRKSAHSPGSASGSVMRSRPENVRRMTAG